MKLEWIDKAIELYKKDYSFLKIGRELGVDRKKVSRELNKLGYSAKYSFATTGGVERKYDVWRKYTFNENFFAEIDCEEKAYWLGFLYADGYVNANKTSVELSLQEKDKEHLEMFRESVGSNAPLSLHSKNLDGKEYKIYRITLNSLKFKTDLVNKGCVENKSHVLKFPSYDIVPKDMMRHFIRGYIDGDGCWYKNSGGRLSLEVLGTEEFLVGMCNELDIHQNTIYNLRHKDKETITKRVGYHGLYAKKIFNKLYDNSKIFLKRKHSKAKICMPS